MTPVLIHLLVCLLLSVSAGLVATTYVNILTQPGQVLAFWARWLYSLRDAFILAVAPDEARLDRRSAHAEYILKPILTCVYCVGGQTGFWLTVYYSVAYAIRFSLVWALLTAVLSVWTAGLFQFIQKKYFPL